MTIRQLREYLRGVDGKTELLIEFYDEFGDPVQAGVSSIKHDMDTDQFIIVEAE